MKRFFDHFFPAGETYVHEERPIDIIVRGNVAVVHYIVSAHSKNESGEHTSTEARWTDTLIKENGRWLLLGDQGGSTARVD
jgi:ketosteroid isomerase-like protein